MTIEIITCLATKVYVLMESLHNVEKIFSIFTDEPVNFRSYDFDHGNDECDTVILFDELDLQDVDEWEELDTIVFTVDTYWDGDSECHLRRWVDSSENGHELYYLYESKDPNNFAICLVKNDSIYIGQVVFSHGGAETPSQSLYLSDGSYFFDGPPNDEGPEFYYDNLPNVIDACGKMWQGLEEDEWPF